MTETRTGRDLSNNYKRGQRGLERWLEGKIGKIADTVALLETSQWDAGPSAALISCRRYRSSRRKAMEAMAKEEEQMDRWMEGAGCQCSSIVLTSRAVVELHRPLCLDAPESRPILKDGAATNGKLYDHVRADQPLFWVFVALLPPPAPLYCHPATRLSLIADPSPIHPSIHPFILLVVARRRLYSIY
ncbi:hypothetical protein An02g04560 [Aspergillus niger]|uniref:Uncharacterized protein n=2 Tax=Aspergillus niger TaxID=5061 RepID=A2QCS4_ASPNC|nr:hypothetical protein An02g04560 [Aspergillus niger]CAK37596.1 hypothetical protein An02g04560 [Aspergillus niger]